jgi:hypothetical protein
MAHLSVQHAFIRQVNCTIGTTAGGIWMSPDGSWDEKNGWGKSIKSGDCLQHKLGKGILADN